MANFTRSFDRAAETARRRGYAWLESQLRLLHRLSRGERVQSWPLLECLAPSQRWRQALQDLIGLVRPPEPSPERVVWVLPHGMHRVEPKLQKTAKKGWTQGKSLDLESCLPPCATEADRRAFEIRRQGANALVELVGHPLVFRDSSRRPVEVVLGSPELRVERTRTEIHVKLLPRLTGEVGIMDDGFEQIRVVQPNEQQRRIYNLLGPGGMTVPVASLGTVQEMLLALSGTVPIVSDVPADGQIEEREAESRLHLRIRPWQKGLEIELLVRPLGEGGPEFPPGEGPEVAVATLAGHTVQTFRDLSSEWQSARTWASLHPTLHDDDLGHWLFRDLQESLTVLEELQSTGQGGLMAEWPEGKPFELRGQAEVENFKISAASQGDWLELSGELQIDETLVLSLDRLLELTGNRHRFVPLQDGQFVSLTDDLRRRLGELKSLAEPAGGGPVRIHSLAAGCLTDLNVVADERIWQRLRELNDEPELAAQPADFRADLRPYQSEGFSWMAQRAKWGVGSCLADDMGLGKTIQVLAVLAGRGLEGPALVIAPTSVCGNWVAEAARFAPTLKLRTLGDSVDRRRIVEEAAAQDVVLASYGLLDREIESLAMRTWSTIILDEAQAIKNHMTKRFQAAVRLQGEVRIAMTGTPVENRLEELWSLFRFLNPGLLSSFDKFRTRFALPIEAGDALRREQLRKLVAPFLLRRTKSQVLHELPSRTEVNLVVALSGDERALYEAIRRRALEKLEGECLTPVTILAELTRLRRACCHPGLVLPNTHLQGSKLKALLTLLQEVLEGGHRALIFSQFVDHLTLIRQALEPGNITYQYLDGSTSAAERTRRVADFQAGQGEVFLISLRAGGVGLNLTGADYVIHMDPRWNPAVEDQASDRAYRMGQTRPVTIYRLITKDTVEEKIVALHAQKRELAEGLLAGTDGGVRISAEDLLRLMREG